MVDLHHYSSQAVDRASGRRRDEAWISQRLADPDTRIVPVWRGRSLLHDGSAVFLAAADVRGLLCARQATAIFLGIDETGPLFALDLSHLPRTGAERHAGPGAFEELYGAAPRLARREASLLSHAAWLVRWSRHHRFCGACGHATQARQAGHVRACTNPGCGLLTFPRTDPAVIVVAEHAGRCLLARQKGWPGRLHSCLAGFVEPGESAEEAVVREIREEAGVDVDDVRFHATQPWPYPCSLMLGFFAVARSDVLSLDDDELAQAGWFSREDLLAPDPGIELPRRDSIARSLIDAWIARG